MREELNQAIWDFGHGRIENAAGQIMDIGGSTGGLSRKVLDDWRQPDLRDFQNFLAEGHRNAEPAPLSAWGCSAYVRAGFSAYVRAELLGPPRAKSFPDVWLS